MQTDAYQFSTGGTRLGEGPGVLQWPIEVMR